MEKYPIPTHLKGIFEVNESLTYSNNLEGKIVCDCGCEEFRIMHNVDMPYDDSVPFGEQDGDKINAICEKCGKTLLVFDRATQGYDGFVLQDFRTADDEALTPLKCKKCGAEVFSIDLAVEVEDQEQFIEECVTEYPDRFTPEDFVDAFNWITVTVKCKDCKDEDEWISLELS